MAKTVEFLNNKYQLYIMPEARRKMELYCDLSEGEIGWLAFVDDLGENGFLITDCALLHQEVHSTTTEITPEGLFTYIFYAMAINNGETIEYKMLTNTDGEHVAKTSLGMFDDKLIDNDISKVIEIIDRYSSGE